jgi:hypothetical protein
MAELLRRLALAVTACAIMGIPAFAQSAPPSSSLPAVSASTGADSIQSAGPGPDRAPEVIPAASVSTGTRRITKSFSSALTNEAQTLDHVTISFLKTIADDEFLRIMPVSGRKALLAAPFGLRARSSQLSSIRGVTSPSAARSYLTDSSLSTLVNWYAEKYGFQFVVRHTPLNGSHEGDTMTVARAVQRIGNTMVSVMIWNPTASGKGRRANSGALLRQTTVEVQERAFRPREELIVEGPDAVVELTWQVPYRDLIQKVSIKYQIDPFLLAALVQQESNFNAGAMSVDSALGLTQMIPTTAEMMGIRNPNDPHQSLDGGARYLKQMLARFKGDPSLALAAYNAGPGNVIKYHGVPPFAETRDYVRRIMARYTEKAAGAKATIAQTKVAS